MKAIVYDTFGGPLTVRSVPDPSPDPDGAVIRVEATGLCRSDWHGWMGHDPDITTPHVPGHELAGVIEAVGKDVEGRSAGDRVTVPFCCGCGDCPECRAGFQNICDHHFQPGFTHWGSFAEFVAIKYADVNLVRLPDEVDFVTAASLGCRFITSFRAVAAQGRVVPGEWVAVHGCGGVGLSAIMIASALGAHVVGVDIDAGKLAFARSAGARATVDGAVVDDVPRALKEITGGGAHVSIDALGSRPTCRNSILCLRKRGRHVQVGLMVGDEGRSAVPLDRVIGRELEILGSHGMQAHKYGEVFDLIRKGALHPDRLVGNRISLEEAPAALAAMDRFPGVGITVIDRM